MADKKLYKIEDGKMVDGECGGIEEYFNMDASLVRILWVLFSLAGGSGILVYIIAAIILPRKSQVQ